MGEAGEAATPPAGEPEPTTATAVPSWVGKAIWRGIWQLIAAVLVTLGLLWFAGQASDLLRYLVLSQLFAFALEPALVYQQLENYILSPRISQNSMNLNAGLAFVAAMAGGAVGAFFALPIAAVIQAFLSTYSRHYEVVESDLTEVNEPTPPEPEPPRWRRWLRRGAGADHPAA
jgi:predicted PurR-regulated permease PerM